MVSYFVRYRGAAKDPGAFHAYYKDHHAPVLGEFPRIRSLVLHSPAVARDPFPVHPGDTFLLAQMQFDSAADLDAALRSPARQKAREDFLHFPPFTGEITHEAMFAKVIF
jgi:uncharacterized protein (TIGR02118 family)